MVLALGYGLYYFFYEVTLRVIVDRSNIEYVNIGTFGVKFVYEFQRIFDTVGYFIEACNYYGVTLGDFVQKVV